MVENIQEIETTHNVTTHSLPLWPFPCMYINFVTYSVECTTVEILCGITAHPQGVFLAGLCDVVDSRRPTPGLLQKRRGALPMVSATTVFSLGETGSLRQARERLCCHSRPEGA